MARRFISVDILSAIGHPDPPLVAGTMEPNDVLVHVRHAISLVRGDAGTNSEQDLYGDGSCVLPDSTAGPEELAAAAAAAAAVDDGAEERPDPTDIRSNESGMLSNTTAADSVFLTASFEVRWSFIAAEPPPPPPPTAVRMRGTDGLYAMLTVAGIDAHDTNWRLDRSKRRGTWALTELPSSEASYSPSCSSSESPSCGGCSSNSSSICCILFICSRVSRGGFDAKGLAPTGRCPSGVDTR
jgi:hypothetical protein